MARQSVKDQIDKILNEYIDKEEEKIEKITKEVAKDTAAELKSTSPRSHNSGKHYADGWRVKNDKTGRRRSIVSVVYNATKPQLTHLLARAHDIANAQGVYGRSTPDPHLDNAEERGNELYLRRLEEEL
ncbi:MAG: HK97 gp10 family phage protein [Lachnospiraceae bacterium]|nr:HK97 gp10 family phage protein [Lachnospiraceae bacterium]